MEASSSSSSNLSSYNRKKSCYCGLPAPVRKSWTDQNPGRLFYGCSKYQEDGCKKFLWYDKGEVVGWPKRSLIEVRDEIKSKNIEIEQIKNELDLLRGGPDNHSVVEAHAGSHDSPPNPHGFKWKDFIFRCLRAG